MIIQPKIRSFICTTAHPLGLKKIVEEQINYVKSLPLINGPKHVLVIGASTGYGLASRITATFAMHAKTIGVFYERNADEKRTASPGWYNTCAFEAFANKEGYIAKSINGDAFSNEIKQKTAEMIRREFGKVDLIIYSVASPKREHPDTHEIFTSALKPIGEVFEGKTVDPFRNEVKSVSLNPASDAEIEATINVMGGDDWQRWIEYLAKENVLAKSVKTISYSYIGPEITHAIYKNGTIGKAKDDLKLTADKLNKFLIAYQGEAIIAVDKAVVTQASAAIPVVPLYIALLFKLMKENNTHEGCIEQMYRLFSEHVYAEHPIARDADGLIRMDDLEMNQIIQEKIIELWPLITSENLSVMTDVEGYREEFYRLFGFGLKDVDYDKDVEPFVTIPSINDET